MAMKEPRCRCPSHTPSGIAMTVATASEASDSQMCSSVLSQISPVLSNRNSIAFSKVFTSRPPRSQPGGEQPLEQHEQGVGHQREGDGQKAGGDELRLEAALDRVEDRLPESADADEGGDGREADRRDRRNPDPRHDRRERQRQLDATQDLALCEAHGAGRQSGVLGHLAQPGQRVPEQDQERVGHERDLGARDGEPCDRHHQLEEREARNRVEERRDRKSTRLNSSHQIISYAVFCLKKKKKKNTTKKQKNTKKKKK